MKKAGINGPYVLVGHSLGGLAMRVWALSQSPRVSGSEGFLAEEFNDLYRARTKEPLPLGDRPLIVLLPKFQYGKPLGGISEEEWKRINDEKRQQKLEFTSLSRNSKLIIAENSGHHVQLDEPQLVIDAIRQVVYSVKPQTRISP